MKKLLAMLLALVMALSMLSVAVFAESNGEEVDTDDTNNVENVEEPEEETNPGTGIALAVVPMMVAAAAVAVSKKH